MSDKIISHMKLLIVITAMVILSNQIVLAGMIRRILGKGRSKTTNPEPSMKYVPLEKSRMLLSDRQENLAAELAFTTLSLGFVYDDRKYPPGMTKLIKDFLKLKQGNEIQDGPFTPEELDDRNVTLRKVVCITRLRESVLVENNIFYDQYVNPATIQYEHKLLHFDYYVKEPEEVFVIKCPITHNSKKKFLYFSELQLSLPLEPRGQYFVMTDSPHQPGRLTILMSTKFFEPDNPSIDDSSRIDSLWQTDSTDPVDFIRLVVPADRLDDNFRLFEMDAERAYITKRYGFINYDPTKQDSIDQLIKYVEILKTGYEADYWHPTKSILYTTHMEEWEKRNLCENYVRRCQYLQSWPILTDNQASEQEIQILWKTITFPNLLVTPQRHRVLQCPVLQGPILMRRYIYFKDVYYNKASKRPKRNSHRFVLVNSDAGDNSINVAALTRIAQIPAAYPRQPIHRGQSSRPAERSNTVQIHGEIQVEGDRNDEDRRSSTG